jgi:hypothetical protein
LHLRTLPTLFHNVSTAFLHRSYRFVHLITSAWICDNSTFTIVLGSLNYFGYIIQVSIKLENKHISYFLLALTAHQTSTFTGWLQHLCCRSCTRFCCRCVFFKKQLIAKDINVQRDSIFNTSGDL